MKEIGKLIELLNEWQEKELGKAGAKYLMFDGINKVFRLNNGCSLCQELVLSHRFCFIQWLVENDKIDLFSRNALLIYEDTENGEKQRPYSFYEEMLIRLAISDTPINDLISYLK